MTTGPYGPALPVAAPWSLAGAQGRSESRPGLGVARGDLGFADNLLVRLAQRGSRRAFERLWMRHAPTAHAVLISMLPAWEAEDVLQDTAVNSWQAMAKLQDPERFVPWLCSIARNLGRDRLSARRAERSVDLGQAADLTVHDRSPAMAEADEVLTVMRGLPECYREPLVLRLVLGLTGPEIAEKMGMTKGSVRVNLHRGMKLLRQALEDDES